MNLPEKRKIKHSKLKVQLLLTALPPATTLQASATEQERKQNLFSVTIKTGDQGLTATIGNKMKSRSEEKEQAKH